MELVNQATMYAFREKSKYVLKDIWRLVLTIWNIYYLFSLIHHLFFILQCRLIGLKVLNPIAPPPPPITMSEFSFE